MGVACLTRPNHVFLYAHRLSYRWRLHAITRESAIVFCAFLKTIFFYFFHSFGASNR